LFVLISFFIVVSRDIEESWLGPWKCLLLGRQSANKHIEATLSSIVTSLKKEFDLKVNPALIKAILGGVASVDEVHKCLYQLILYKGYFGCGECCEKGLTSLSSNQINDESLDTLKKCLNENAVDGLLESVDRSPVILVLDINVQVSNKMDLLLAIFLMQYNIPTSLIFFWRAFGLQSLL